MCGAINYLGLLILLLLVKGVSFLFILKVVEVINLINFDIIMRKVVDALLLVGIVSAIDPTKTSEQM
jgi:hypothetical protein